MNRNPILNIVLSILTPVIFILLGGALFYLGCTWTIGDPLELADTYLLEQRPDFSGRLDDIYGGEGSASGVVSSANTALTDSGTVELSSIQFPSYETIYGQITCARIGLDAPLIFGDSMNALDEGAAQSTASFIPGYGGTILAGGHNNTYFNCLQNITEGDVIRIDTSYGQYAYQVSSVSIHDKNDSDAYPLSRDREQLILYTCHPFDALGTVSNRYFVYADYLSGPRIKAAAQQS